MNTPLQSTHLSVDEANASLLSATDEAHGEGEAHIHMPNPSWWPLILAAAILICISGLLTFEGMPWATLITAPLVLIGIMGWALEDPFGAAVGHRRRRRASFARSYAEAAETGAPTVLAEQMLEEAQDVADRTVTVSSTAYSAHPVKVVVEREGVVLALYGRIELEAQRKELEDALKKLPGVIDVKNFVVAEDALLNQVNAAIDRLKASGKLEGANDITALVENYIVNLYGDVPNQSMKSLLEREIVGIPGVRVVVNHIGLNKDIPGNLGKTRNK